jgi:hypothetical protein
MEKFVTHTTIIISKFVGVVWLSLLHIIVDDKKKITKEK